MREHCLETIVDSAKRLDYNSIRDVQNMSFIREMMSLRVCLLAGSGNFPW